MSIVISRSPSMTKNPCAGFGKTLMPAETDTPSSPKQAFTFTPTVAVFTQPLASVPVTVKFCGVVTAGLMVNDGVVAFEVQAYEVPPVAEMVFVSPLHITRREAW